MNVGQQRRAELSKYPHLVDELDNLIAGIRGAWSVEHSDEDGHKDITGYSLTLTEDPETGATGDLSADGDGTFGGTVIAQDAGRRITIGDVGSSAGRTGAGFRIEPDTAAAAIGIERWEELVAAGPAPLAQSNGIIFQHKPSAGTFMPAMLWYDVAAGQYHLSPEAVTNGTRPCTIGDAYQAATGGYWTKVYVKVGGVVESHYAAGMGVWTTFTPTRTATAGTWTAGNLTTAQYRIVGKSMLVVFYISNTSVSNAGVTLKIAIPGGFVANKDIAVPILISNAGATGTGIASVSPAGTTIAFQSSTAFGLFGISAGATDVIGSIEFEVQ